MPLVQQFHTVCTATAQNIAFLQSVDPTQPWRISSLACAPNIVRQLPCIEQDEHAC